MRFKLVPTDDKFFDLFSDSAVNAAEAAKRLHALITDFTDVKAKHDAVVEYQLPFGDWIRLFRRNGLVIEDLIELRNSIAPYPLENIWKLRKGSVGLDD